MSWFSGRFQWLRSHTGAHLLVMVTGFLIYGLLMLLDATGFAEIVVEDGNSIIIPVVYDQSIELNDLSFVIKNNFLEEFRIGEESVAEVQSACSDDSGYQIPTRVDDTGQLRLKGSAVVVQMDVIGTFCVVMGFPRVMEGFEVSLLGTDIPIPVRIDDLDVEAYGYKLRFTSTDSSTRIEWKPLNAFGVLLSTTLVAIGITGVIEQAVRYLTEDKSTRTAIPTPQTSPDSPPSQEAP